MTARLEERLWPGPTVRFDRRLLQYPHQDENPQPHSGAKIVHRADTGASGTTAFPLDRLHRGCHVSRNCLCCLQREIDVPKEYVFLRTGIYDLGSNTAGTQEFR